ncbi:MAG: hypothetical protein U1F61_17200 [Opitutaceae bacterium]
MTTPLLSMPVRTLDVQRAEFSRRRFLAMPLAGTIAWSVIGVASLVLKPWPLAITLFAATGSIAYLGMAISRLTGENFLDKSRPKNAFDALFMMTVGMSVLVYAIAIPFFRIEPSSLPLSVGILTGLMWLPLSWVIQHWIGIFMPWCGPACSWACGMDFLNTVTSRCRSSLSRSTASPSWCWSVAGARCVSRLARP